MWAKPLETSFFSSSESASDLKALFDFVRTSLTPAGSDSWKGPVLLVDDLSVLLSLGATPVAVLDFIHYCRVTVCYQLKVLLPLYTASCTLHVEKSLWSKAWLSFLFSPVHGEVWKALAIQEIQIIALGPLSGSCVSPWSASVGSFATGFPGEGCSLSLKCEQGFKV